MVDARVVEPRYVPTDSQAADVITKALSTEFGYFIHAKDTRSCEHVYSSSQPYTSLVVCTSA